jgi:AcrR family transcriptional regulator
MKRDARFAITCSGGRARSRDLESLLLRAADVLLRRDGLDGITVRSVATEAGVAPAGVYSRFGSKDGLVDALLVEAAGELQRAVLSSGEPDPLERLRCAARRYRRWALSNPQHYHAIFLSRGDLASAAVAQSLATVFELGVSMHEYAIANGVIGLLDARQSCARFWCAIHGAIAFELRALIPPDEAGPNFEAVLTMVLRGLA